MMLRIVHKTGYEYAGGAVASYNQARMTPRSTLHQQVLHTRVEISPPAWTHTYTDYWGTTVTAFEVHERHDTLTVTSSATVDVRRPEVPGEALSWEQVRDPPTQTEHSEYLQMSDQVRPPDDLLHRVQEMARQATTPGDCARTVVQTIHDEMSYVTGSTGVHTHASDAWENRQGVCQDMANLTIGCLRSVGIPTCYVSGYLMPPREPEVGVVHTGESHAWVRYWDGVWVGADPTNAIQPRDRHVEVAQGRQYGDVPPLRGIFTGMGTSTMFVEVELTRLN
ncbi:MAG: transglutaminase family protein [Actinobacteria bacterium]|nr:transglutaminase family protein [Actinomycetota bacterium]